MAQEHEIISPHVVGSALVLTQKVPVQQTQKLCHMSEGNGLSLVSSSPGFVCLTLCLFLEGVVQMDAAFFKNLSLIMAKQDWQQKNWYIKASSDILWTRNDITRFLLPHIQPQTRLQTGWRRCMQGDQTFIQVLTVPIFMRYLSSVLILGIRRDVG